MINSFLQDLTITQSLEWLAAGLGVVSAWYIKEEKVVGYPLGMGSVALYVWICFDAKIYAHMGINLYYFGMSAYGWYYWRVHSQTQGKMIRYCRAWEYVTLACVLPLLSFILYRLLTTFTDSDIAGWDTLTTTLWAGAMWLMARKCIENWIGWIIGDIICIPLYFQKALYFSSLQFLVFLCIATLGWMHWRKKYRIAHTHQQSTHG